MTSIVQQLLVNQFIFALNGIVFAVLTFFLWMYYRAYGRQYVLLWSLSSGAVAISLVAMALQQQLGSIYDISPLALLFQSIEQIFKYLALSFLLSGLYCAQQKYFFTPQKVFTLAISAIVIGLIASLTFSFEPNDIFNRFYLRVSLINFIFGICYLLASLYLFSHPRQYFSSRVFAIFSAIFGLGHISYSFISVLEASNQAVQLLFSFTPYWYIAEFSLSGFGMLLWIYGAERNAASTALSKARYLGEHDALTGLLNREQVLEKLANLMQTNKHQTLAIFLLDIKRFKFINDTYGLKNGDYILEQIGQRLTHSILMPLIVGRLSGDSFIFTIELSHDNQAQQTAQHLHELINRDFYHQQQTININCSVGYCFYPEDGDVAEDLLQKANLALYQAESQQLASVAFTEGMQHHGRQLVQIEQAIKKALQQNQFILYFQPQLNLFTNRLEGVEALIRWQHPEKGLLPPAAFLEDIELLGMSNALDNYVLELACQTIALWHEKFNRRVVIAVNISAVEFQNVKLIATIQGLLFKYNIPPKYLELEITENVVMTEIKSAMRTISTLQNMGIKVSIDDFGTGYSSLAYLRALPIDKIKIDRSFIKEVAQNDSDLTIVKSMIELSRGLGKRVLAEGVETEEQLNTLKALGCDAVQGYYISKPIPESQIERYLKRR